MKAILNSGDNAVTGREHGLAGKLSLNLRYISSAVLWNHLIWFNKSILKHTNVLLCE